MEREAGQFKKNQLKSFSGHMLSANMWNIEGKLLCVAFKTVFYYKLHLNQ